ncbi:MAG: hypothetical protein CL762_03670 [Chloroflexi bacterium]|nr:hypothetical protein [Chloroflexota bacterium]
MIFYWETLGQKELTKNLYKIYDEKKVPNALILYGEKGLGKMSLAKDFSRLINCEENSSDKNKICTCMSCDKINNLSHPDFTIIERSSICSDIKCGSCKSSKGQQIRECVISENIISKSRFKPFMGKHKVVVVNQANYLSKVSSESLLKTLEDIDSNFLIIFLIENLSDIAETIISRCQIWKLNKISKQNTLEILLEKYSDREKDVAEIMSFGSPTLGEASDMLDDPIFFEERQEVLRRIVKIFNSPMSDKLNYSKELTLLYRKDKERVLHELKIWKNLFRKILRTEDTDENLETISILKSIKEKNKLKIKKNIENILSTENNLKFNAIPSLVFDKFIINLEA